MAKLSDLVRVLSISGGDSEASVAVIARALRERNLIKTGGRGRSAAHMTSADAASLLLGVASPGENTKAAQSVQEVAKLMLEPQARIVQPVGYPHTDELRGIMGIGAGDDLSACLTTLLDRYRLEPDADRPRPNVRPPGGIFRSEEPENFLPRGIEIEVVREQNTWRSTLFVRFSFWRIIELYFTSQTNPAPKKGSGKRSSILIQEDVVSSIVSCLRNLSPHERNTGTTACHFGTPGPNHFPGRRPRGLERRHLRHRQSARRLSKSDLTRGTD